MSTFDRNCDWYCDCCGAYMNSQNGFTAISGVWTCSNCGTENDVSEDNILDDSEDITEEEEEVPEGCAACGGNYPYCKDGCPLFDDD